MARVTDIADPQGGRNRVRAGDPVRVDAGASDKSSFPATFEYADTDDAGEIVSITVFGGRGYQPLVPRTKQPEHARLEWRTVRPNRVRRMARATIERKVSA